MTAATPDHHLIDGRKVAIDILRECEKYTVKQHALGRLVSICIGDVPETEVYVRNQARGAKRAGLPFEQVNWDATITQNEAKQVIQQMNNDASILGVIIQRPAPEHINIRSLQSAVHPLKDVEGMNPASIGNIVYSDVALAPCTAAASVELIKKTGLKLKGLEVVMIGHSEIVGKPAAMMLMAEGANVTVCHHLTRSVTMHSRRADVVVVAVGIAGFIGPEMIKPGAAVIDIGINQIQDEDGNFKIVGDVQTEAVTEVAGWVTPVPGGVGPVTVAILIRNAIVAHKRQIAAGWIE